MRKHKPGIRGTVRSLLVSPKGMYEGLLIENKGELIQINFPPEWGTTIADLAAQGDDIQAEVESQESKGHGQHSVYRLLSISGHKKKIFSLKEPLRLRNGHFSGTVVTLNYALHGEVNGAILDTGDFLHVKPHGGLRALFHSGSSPLFLFVSLPYSRHPCPVQRASPRCRGGHLSAVW